MFSFSNYRLRFQKYLSRGVKSKAGFTLIETLVAIGIFVVIIGLASGIFVDAFAVDRKTAASRVLYEESRIVLERIVKEMRRGTIDYEEYWSQYRIVASPVQYGKNYGDYGRQFFRNSSNDVPDVVTREHENVGRNFGATPLGDPTLNCLVPTPIVDHSGYSQCELYLITADGTEKTVLKVLPEHWDVGVDEWASGVDPIDATKTEYRLAMLKLVGSDPDGDAQIDTWEPMSDFGTSGAPKFVKIQPNSIKITNLKFIISPIEDPRKAFADFSNDVQIQPHLTIVMTTEPSEIASRGTKGKKPQITLQTTVSARAQSEVKSLPF